MSKISYVATCAEPGEGMFGILLDIHFDNGQIILLSLKEKKDNPAFLSLYISGELNRPKTDGDSIYWKNGPRLFLHEIMEMARRI